MKRALEVLNQLVADGVIRDYAIGGAMGATFYLEPISTMDLDVFVLFTDETSLAPLQPIYRALMEMGFHPDEHERECVNIGGTPVQFLPVYNALLAEALENARHISYDGVPTKVLGAEHLAAICVQTGRMKDKLRVQSFLSSERFDRKRFVEICAEHGLVCPDAEESRCRRCDL